MRRSCSYGENPGWFAPVHSATTARSTGRRAGREAHPQHRSVVGVGVDVDGAAVAVHDDATGDVQPEPGSASGVLGGVEGLERAGHHLWWHARTGVADL